MAFRRTHAGRIRQTGATPPSAPVPGMGRGGGSMGQRIIASQSREIRQLMASGRRSPASG
jgi:hypothetical protein